MSLRETTEARIRACRRCGLADGCRGPVAFKGRTPNGLAIQGEAPGPDEDVLGIPFIGPSLRGQLDRLGLEPFVFNTVSCYPHGRPTEDAVEKCRVNVMLQLAVCKPTFIILLGAFALETWRDDGMKPSQARGRPFWREVQGRRTILLPTWHPAAAMRNRKWMAEFEQDMELFAGMYQAGYEAAMDDWPVECQSCGREVWRYDRFGTAWCMRHWEGGRPWREAVKVREARALVTTERRRGQTQGLF